MMTFPETAFATAALRVFTGVQTAFDIPDEPLKRPYMPLGPAVRYLTAARLFPRTEGSPVLFTGDRWLQWRPWLGSFGALARDPTGIDDWNPQ